MKLSPTFRQRPSRFLNGTPSSPWKLSLVLLVILCSFLNHSNAQVYTGRDIPPAPPSAVPTFNLRPVKMVQHNGRIYTLFYLGNAANTSSGRFTIKVSDLDGNPITSPSAVGSWNYDLGSSCTVRDFIIDQVSGDIIISGSAGFIGKINTATGALSRFTLSTANGDIVAMQQFDGIYSSNLVVLVNDWPFAVLYVLDRVTFAPIDMVELRMCTIPGTPGTYNVNTGIITQPVPGVGVRSTQGKGLAITDVSNKILVGLHGSLSIVEPGFYAFDFNGSNLSVIDIEPSGGSDVGQLFTPSSAYDVTLDGMASIPGTDNAVFTYSVNNKTGVGLFNFDNSIPTNTTITFRNSVNNATLSRRASNIAVAPNGSEAAVSAMALPGGGPLAPIHRIGLSTVWGITSFTSTETLFTPNVSYAPNPNSEVVVAYDDVSNLYGYISSHDFTVGRNIFTDGFWQFRTPWLGSPSLCTNAETIEAGYSFTKSPEALEVWSLSSSVTSTPPYTLDLVAFGKLCQGGCGAEPSSVSQEFAPENREFCEKPGINGVWFDFCNYLSTNGYTMPANYLITLTDLSNPPSFEPYSSDQYIAGNPTSNGCLNHHLTEGSFEFRVYNKSNCTYARLIVTVTKTVDEEHNFTFLINCPTESSKTVNINTEPLLNQCSGTTSLIDIFENGSPMIYTLPNVTFTPGNTYQVVYYKSYGCSCIYNFSVECQPQPIGQSNPYAKVAGEAGIKNQGNISRTTGIGSVAGNGNSAINVYPNPSAGIFNISMSNSQAETYDIVIYDLTGKVIYSRISLNSSTVNQIDLSAFANGMYAVKVIVGDQSQYFKLIKN